jgi:hypothetical protein
MFIVKVTNDYSQSPYADAVAAIEEDCEVLKGYGAILSEEEPNPGVKVWVVELSDEDGWSARGQWEETLSGLHGLPSWERLEKAP